MARGPVRVAGARRRTLWVRLDIGIFGPSRLRDAVIERSRHARDCSALLMPGEKPQPVRPADGARPPCRRAGHIMTEARLTRIEIDGVEIPVADGEQLTLPDEDAVAQVLEMLETIEEAERPGFILTTSTSHG